MLRNTLLLLLLIGVGSIRECPMPTIREPQMHFSSTVAADFRDLANDTWAQFLSTFSARTDCFGDVTLNTNPDLESRAVYDPRSTTVTVRVPGTPAFLQAALVHEWAHHVEFQCDAHQKLRPTILSLLNLPSDTAWRAEHQWADSPSEHYAEAVVELVLGDHPLPTKIRVNQDIVSILSEWSKGSNHLE
ncbi:MAG: hypothetical protein AAF702_22010 [Chloroflexota bacterium]